MLKEELLQATKGHIPVSVFVCVCVCMRACVHMCVWVSAYMHARVLMFACEGPGETLGAHTLNCEIWHSLMRVTSSAPGDLSALIYST